jgi:hypothetical protein
MQRKGKVEGEKGMLVQGVGGGGKEQKRKTGRDSNGQSQRGM